jgi:hypothetical protein
MKRSFEKISLSVVDKTDSVFIPGGSTILVWMAFSDIEA